MLHFFNAPVKILRYFSTDTDEILHSKGVCMMKSHLFLCLGLLALFLSSCDMSQFDPSAHWDRYEQERINSNVKRFELTEEGKIPEGA